MVKILLLCLLLFSCSPYISIDRTVKYEVTGTTIDVDITMENENGDVSQYSDKPIPWIYTFRGYEDMFVYISAQNNYSTGSVICAIYLNDELIEKNNSEGAYVIATASCLLP